MRSGFRSSTVFATRRGLNRPKMSRRHKGLTSSVFQCRGDTVPTTVEKTTQHRPTWLPESVWPFQTLGLKVYGTRLAVAVADAGPVLLFVHTGASELRWQVRFARLRS